MKRPNFTAERVASFRCEDGRSQTIHWDGKQLGLGLRVTASGARSYVFESRLHGKTVRMTIGSPDVWTIPSAQARARELKSLTDRGIDPRVVESQQKAADAAHRAQEEAERLAAENAKVTVGQAWAAYLNHHAKRWGARHYRDHINLSQAGGEAKKRGKGLTVPGVLHPLMAKRLADISPDVLREWMEAESATRANNARQGFELFRPFWRWCASRPEYQALVRADIVDDKDLRADVPSRKSKIFDVLQKSQLAAWFGAVRSLSNAVHGVYLQCALLTGARREELAAMRWEHVNFQWNSLWIKDKVEAEGRMIPLTPYLRGLLLNLKRINEAAIVEIDGKRVRKPSPWVFFSATSQDGRISEPRMAHNRALAAAGLHHVTIHGLRRSFASLAEWVEMPKGVVAQIMGHKPNATAERHYINRPLDLLAIWHGKYEAWILEQAGVAVEAQPAAQIARIA